MVDVEMLKKIMEKNKVSISELGRLSDVSKSTLSELMTGKRSDIRLSSLDRISKALKVEINLLIK